MKLSNMLSSPATATSSLLGLNILNLCSSLSVKDQVSHPYKIKGKIIVLYTLILKFLHRRWEDK